MAKAQYEKRRRTRGRQLLEMVALVLIGAGIGLAVLGVAIYVLVQLTSGKVALWVIGGLVAFGALIGLLVLLWIRFHWRGKKARELANFGRGGEVQTVAATDGTSLHVEVEGRADAALTLVFLHGQTYNLATWHHQREMLQGTRFRRVFYDARGHGRSKRGRLDHAQPGVRQLADDLGRVIDAAAANGPIILVGHAMGAMSMLALPAVRPDVMDRVRGMVLCSATAGPLGKTFTLGIPKFLAPLRWVVRREAAGALMLVGLAPKFVQRLLGLAPYLVAIRLIAVHEVNSKRVVRPAAAMVYDTGMKDAGDILSAMFEHDERPVLAQLGRARVAVLAGRNDRLIPFPDQEALAAGIPNCRFTKIAGCGHMLPLEYPNVLNNEMGVVIENVLHELPRPAAPAQLQKPPPFLPQGPNDLGGAVLGSIAQAGQDLFQTGARFLGLGGDRK